MDDVDKSLVSQNSGFVLIYCHFHLPFKQGVRSSNLRWVTKRNHHDICRGGFFWSAHPLVAHPSSFYLLWRTESTAKVLLRKTLITLNLQRPKIHKNVALQRFHGGILSPSISTTARSFPSADAPISQAPQLPQHMGRRKGGDIMVFQYHSVLHADLHAPLQVHSLWIVVRGDAVSRFLFVLQHYHNFALSPPTV